VKEGNTPVAQSRELDDVEEAIDIGKAERKSGAGNGVFYHV